ncbi:LuxR family transcriptional regulator [Enterobacter cloacae subsp. cloacae]|uniref:helix-turn-helix transcriptional regulator n=1 Tax=Enterobacter cloacae TaxID=550 RepID=UPI00063A99EC|nr:helix-turn-helix transcriptional regulator [Enterobacter cloacae]KLG05275.1 LuxR family transcriptional regulator [Enterobacter cloacae subsp. cloacae]
MLNILLMDSNYYHGLGLKSLILSKLTSERLQEARFALYTDEMSAKTANIIFYDDFVTINILNKKQVRCNGDPWRGDNSEMKKITLHVPFLTKNQTLNDISMKIGKILTIANADYHVCLNKKDSYWSFGLKKYAQLSDAENDVMLLIGLGYNSYDISRMLNRSQKTISTHYRNASRKMGASNQAEFYRYASFVARCGCNERNTLCL